MNNCFGEKLKELREEKGLSQRQLAQKLNVTSAAVSRWEANLQTPNIDVAITVATFFGVSTDYLLGLEK